MQDVMPQSVGANHANVKAQNPKETRGTWGRGRVGNTIWATPNSKGPRQRSSGAELGNDDRFRLGIACFPPVPIASLVEPRLPKMLV